MKLKITGGLFKGRMIDAPKGKTTRPTSEKLRKTMFDICQMKTEDSTVLDLFAGSGALGLESISRGANFAYLVDNDHSAQTCILQNAKALQIENKASLIKLDVFKAIDKLEKSNIKLDLVFIDPPYATDKLPIGLAEKVLANLDGSGILNPECLVFLEEGRYFNEERALQSLSHLKLKSKRQAGDSSLFEFIYE